jgi:hypothetical protein
MEKMNHWHMVPDTAFIGKAYYISVNGYPGQFRFVRTSDAWEVTYSDGDATHQVGVLKSAATLTECNAIMAGYLNWLYPNK